MNIYYVYAYLRLDLTPYLVGKGKRRRAFIKAPNHYPPKDRSRIIFLQDKLTEQEAHLLEMIYIKLWGRKNIGTGILNNLTDGGEGVSGLKHSAETKVKQSIIKIGHVPWNKGIPHSIETRAKISAAKLGKIIGPHSNETKVKISLGNIGKHHPSDESRVKMSIAQRKRVCSVATRAKISANSGMTKERRVLRAMGIN